MTRRPRRVIESFRSFVSVAIVLTNVLAPVTPAASMARASVADGMAQGASSMSMPSRLIERTRELSTIEASDESVTSPGFESPLPTPTPETQRGSPVSADGGEDDAPPSVGNVITATLSADDRTLTSPGGAVTVEFPPSVVQRGSRTFRLYTKPAPPRAPAQPRFLLSFGLEDAGEDNGSTGKEDSHLRFQEPVTVTVDLAGRAHWMMYPYLLHQTDVEDDTWELVPSDYDRGTNLLTAAVDTFSDYGVAGEVNPQEFFFFRSWPHTYRPLQRRGHLCLCNRDTRGPQWDGPGSLAGLQQPFYGRRHRHRAIAAGGARLEHRGRDEDLPRDQDPP